jgi:hypothetical protein
MHRPLDLHQRRWLNSGSHTIGRPTGPRLASAKCQRARQVTRHRAGNVDQAEADCQTRARPGDSFALFPLRPESGQVQDA